MYIKGGDFLSNSGYIAVFTKRGTIIRRTPQNGEAVGFEGTAISIEREELKDFKTLFSVRTNKTRSKKKTPKTNGKNKKPKKRKNK